MGGFAWVTLATNDSYSLGALVLAHSLRQVNTLHQLAVLVTPGVTSLMREKLASVFNVVREVNVLDSRDEANLRLLKRPELGITFTKLHCWRLTQFDKCVFLDADTMVLANADELFDREEFSAAPDVGWPDCFNSGVFVYRPSEETYSNLVQFALDKGSFDGGDQGLLNLYFSDWAHKDISKHLPFIYNMCSTACYSYLPAFKQFGGAVKIIHFIGNSKPWLQYFDSETRQVQVVNDIQHLQVVVQQWWNIFCTCIHPMLSSEMAGLAGAFARLTLGVPRTPEQAMLEDQLRRQGWEVGNIDYTGRDSFDNIWSKICETLSTGSSPVEPPPTSSVEEPSQAVPVQEAKQAISETVHISAEKSVDLTQVQKEDKLPTPGESTQTVAVKSQIENVSDSPPSVITQPTEDMLTQAPVPASTLTQTETHSQKTCISLQQVSNPEIKEILATPETPKSVSFAAEPLKSIIPISEPLKLESDDKSNIGESAEVPAAPECAESEAQCVKSSITETCKPVSTPVTELPEKQPSAPDSQKSSELMKQTEQVSYPKPEAAPQPSEPSHPELSTPKSPEPAPMPESPISTPVSQLGDVSPVPKPSTPESPKLPPVSQPSDVPPELKSSTAESPKPPPVLQTSDVPAEPKPSTPESAKPPPVSQPSDVPPEPKPSTPESAKPPPVSQPSDVPPQPKPSTPESAKPPPVSQPSDVPPEPKPSTPESPKPSAVSQPSDVPPEPKPSTPESPKPVATPQRSEFASLKPSTPETPTPPESVHVAPIPSTPPPKTTVSQPTKPTAPKPSTTDSSKSATSQPSEPTDQKPSAPESPKIPSSQFSKQVPAAVEPTKKAPPVKAEPEKAAEHTKAKADPTAKVAPKSAPAKSGDSQEQIKTSAPKASPGAGSAQKPSPAKEAGDEGPTPPPRKSASGGAAGGKKSGKGKK